jgi:hypothetical protein
MAYYILRNADLIPIGSITECILEIKARFPRDSLTSHVGYLPHQHK